MKNKYDIIVGIFIVIILAITLWGGYAIATSDLPDWVKFWILR